jgi:hypothetical protein
MDDACCAKEAAILTSGDAGRHRRSAYRGVRKTLSPGMKGSGRDAAAGTRAAPTGMQPAPLRERVGFSRR